jgi:hypothetical protein
VRLILGHFQARFDESREFAPSPSHVRISPAVPALGDSRAKSHKFSSVTCPVPSVSSTHHISSQTTGLLSRLIPLALSVGRSEKEKGRKKARDKFPCLLLVFSGLVSSSFLTIGDRADASPSQRPRMLGHTIHRL